MTNIKKAAAGMLSVAALVGADQWTKALATEKLQDGPFVLIEGVFEFFYSENRGAAFGIMQNQRTLFLILTLIVVAGIAYCFMFLPNTRRFLPLRGVCVLMASGALGNMIDRAMLHYVVDFLYFKLIDFPIFNVADCYITISAALLLILIIFYYKDEELDEAVKGLKIWKKN